MGTVVFPDAALKFYLIASPQERARRRYKQLKEKGLDVNLADLAREIRERDERDRKRSVAPLRPAESAIQLDTTKMTIEEVMQVVWQEVVKIFPELA
jgi:cytidylate kinase